MKRIPLLWMILACVSADALGREIWLTSDAAARTLMRGVEPGDTVILANGEWRDLVLELSVSGTAEAPVVVRAETPGQVRLTGRGSIRISGSYIEVRDLHFDEMLPADGSEALVSFRGEDGKQARDSRLSGCLFTACNPEDLAERFAWVRLHGLRNRVDHCRFEEMDFNGVTVQVMLREGKASHRIDHNHFLRRKPGDGNGFECIQVGQSGDSMKSGLCIIESNWFEDCDGETEIVSNKSGENIYRRNRFIRSSGTLTLRHGNDCVVEDNVFIGEYTQGSGGVRVVGTGHRVVNNWFERLSGRTGGVVVLYHGIPDSALSGYFAADGAVIEGNTFLHNSGPAIYLNGGAGGRNRVIEPRNVQINANDFIGSGAGSELALSGGLDDMQGSDNRLLGGIELGAPDSSIFDDSRGGTGDGTLSDLALAEVGPSWALPVKDWILWHPVALSQFLNDPSEDAASLRDTLLAAAQHQFNEDLSFSVTFNERIPPSGDLRDYYSTGPYWWPDPETENGLPYIQRDGQFNPERDLVSDREPLHLMVEHVRIAALAWLLTGERRYGQRAAQLLNTWFLDDTTGMRPNLNHAQAIPGRSDGRGRGIIDALVFVDLFDALLLLETSPDWSRRDQAKLRDWFHRYADWLSHHALADEERRAHNNHGTAYDLQIAAVAAFLGRDEQVCQILESSVGSRILQQIEVDGRQPHELARTRTWSYTTENLFHFYRLARIGAGRGYDWLAEEDQQAGHLLKSALNYALPYICEPDSWPHPQKTEWQWEFITPVLRMALAYDSRNEALLEASRCLPQPDLQTALRSLIAPMLVTAPDSTAWFPYKWDAGVRGGIPSVPDQIVLSDSDLQDDPHAVIQQAVNLINGKGAVRLPAGSYRLTESLTLRTGVVLRGADNNQTELIFVRESYPDASGTARPAWGAIQMQGERMHDAIALTGGYEKGSVLLELAYSPPEDIVAGRLILVFSENDPDKMYTQERWDVEWAAHSIAQIVEVRNVIGNQIQIDTPLRLDYKTDLNPRISLIIPIEWAGVENLIVRAEGELDDNIIGIEAARNCWVANTETIHTGRGHIWVNFSRHISVVNNLCHHANYYGGGGRGYGIIAGNIAVDCLFEGNELHNLRHSIMAKRGSNGNVFRGNLSHTRRRHPEGSPLLCDISIHGHFSYANLFDGNIVDFVELADFWGPTGPGTVFYRNTIREHISIKDHSHETVIVNNWIGGGIDTDGTSQDLVIFGNQK